jgi:GPI mannosyltransferase 3
VSANLAAVNFFALVCLPTAPGKLNFSTFRPALSEPATLARVDRSGSPSDRPEISSTIRLRHQQSHAPAPLPPLPLLSLPMKPSPPASLVWPSILTLLLFRSLCACFSWTYGNPDEYWQAPEVAHALVFGKGYIPWEWWPSSLIRSSFHVWLIALLYKCLALVSLDHWFLVFTIPRILHTVIMTWIDYMTLQIAIFISPSSIKFVLIAHLINWYLAYTTPRPIINTLECFFCVSSVYLWISSRDRFFSPSFDPTAIRNTSLAAFLVVFGGLVRPSLLLFWAPFALTSILQLVIQLRSKKSSSMNQLTLFLFRTAFFILPSCIAAFLLSLLFDYMLFGKLVIPLLNFYRFNVTLGVDKLYGVYPFYWYFVDGLLLPLAGLLPFIVLFLRKQFLPQNTKKENTNKLSFSVVNELAVCSFVYVLLLSTASHKEHRFLLPVLPFFSIMAGEGISEWINVKKRLNVPSFLRYLLDNVLVIIGSAHIFLFLYISCIHQFGSVAIASHFGHLFHRLENPVQFVESRNQSNQVFIAPVSSFFDVHFLMPCHSTPFYSVIHNKYGSLVQLDCNPYSRLPSLLDSSELKTNHHFVRNFSESTLFETDPASFLDQMYGPTPSPPLLCEYESTNNLDSKERIMPPSSAPTGIFNDHDPALMFAIQQQYRNLPTHIVMFDTHATSKKALDTFLYQNNYVSTLNISHAHFSGDAHSNTSPRNVQLFEHICSRRITTKFD